MKLVIDIEANGLEDPTQIWVIVCKNILDGSLEIFRNVTSDKSEKERFLRYAQDPGVDLFVGHNWLGYDYPVLNKLIGLVIHDVAERSCDTLIISKLIDYSRNGHAIEDYGREFGLEKISFNDFSKYSLDMENYCVRDVQICERIYNKYLRYINNPDRRNSIVCEHAFQLLVNDLHNTGFSFNTKRASGLLETVCKNLESLDKEIQEAFPPKKVKVKEFTPKATKYGTISKSSVPRDLRDRIHEFEVGVTYPVYKDEPFNAASHKQIIATLNEAGWKPIDKTQTHIDTERALNRLKYTKHRSNELDLELDQLYTRLQELRITGWKVNEANLNTLPDSAPSPARLLAKRILLESRRRTLTEWLSLVSSDGRVHGKYYGIGAWTHRMAHQSPNTANIPSEFNLDGSRKLLGKEMRTLWQAPRNRLLVGVDAEGIQLRIFAHYIDDQEFTDALVRGKKDDKTDPHSLNQRILGDTCKSRAAAKRFIYALLLGAGLPKLAQILECSLPEAEEALNRLLVRYTGFARLKEELIPKDASRGYFIGLDHRAVAIPGDTAGARRHLCMSGYLQNGEAVVMKRAALKWWQPVRELRGYCVNFVHDEWQTECPNNMDVAIKIAKLQADAIRLVGEELNLKCPLAGSYWNEDHKDYTIGTNWYQTH